MVRAVIGRERLSVTCRIYRIELNVMTMVREENGKEGKMYA